MTGQKKCENCRFWYEAGLKGSTGATSNGGKSREPEIKTGFCEKHNEGKSAYDTCDDWEPKKIDNK